MDRFPGALKRKGYTADGIRHGLDKERHLLRSHGMVPALDAEAVGYWSDAGVSLVRVEFTDGDVWLIPLASLLTQGFTVDYGHGKQWTAPRPKWLTGHPKDQPELISVADGV